MTTFSIGISFTMKSETVEIFSTSYKLIFIIASKLTSWYYKGKMFVWTRTLKGIETPGLFKFSPYNLSSDLKGVA